MNLRQLSVQPIRDASLAVLNVVYLEPGVFARLSCRFPQNQEKYLSFKGRVFVAKPLSKNADQKVGSNEIVVAKYQLIDLKISSMSDTIDAQEF